jgi:beta-aspartyl-peptidase (threonine type)
MEKSKRKRALLAHGGAGNHPANKKQLQKLSEAIQEGYLNLKHGGTSLDAVETVIRLLENSTLFNAGTGSFLQLDQRCRMDASIMEGKNLKAGAVAGIEEVLNPIQAARLVMDKTSHVLMTGEGAKKLAKFYKLRKAALPTKKNVERVKDILNLKNQTVKLFKAFYPHETVGAVALDFSGNVAAGASTGGIPTMLPGRIGDSPLIGSGIYADNESGAVSMTGWGESIIRLSVAKEICTHIQNGVSPLQATQRTLKRLIKKIKGHAGAIVLNKKGQFALLHTTPYMCAGYCLQENQILVGNSFKKIQ